MPIKYDPTKICQHLRCKEMLIHVDNPEYGADDMGLFDPYDAVAYWCERTQTGRGPDGDRAHLGECACPSARRCFVGIDQLT